MHSNDLFLRHNTLTLSSSIPAKVNLGKLPLGSFIYRFKIVNTDGAPRKLTILFSGKGWKTEESLIEVTDFSTLQNINFNTTSAFGYCSAEFSCDPGNELHLHLPVSPILVQQTEERPVFLLGIDEKVLTRIDEIEMDNPLYKGRKQRFSSGKGDSRVSNPKEIEALVHARYFKGFLSLDEAERQLDYVVFHKMFRIDGDKGFVRIKKTIYGKILRGFYRLLGKNRFRKRYLAKLYCNYVNMGTLAENLQ